MAPISSVGVEEHAPIWFVFLVLVEYRCPSLLEKRMYGFCVGYGLLCRWVRNCRGWKPLAVAEKTVDIAESRLSRRIDVLCMFSVLLLASVLVQGLATNQQGAEDVVQSFKSKCIRVDLVPCDINEAGSEVVCAIFGKIGEVCVNCGLSKPMAELLPHGVGIWALVNACRVHGGIAQEACPPYYNGNVVRGRGARVTCDV